MSCASCCNWQARGCAWATAGLLVAVGTAANGWVGPDIVGTHTVNVDGVGTLTVHSVSRRNIKVVGCEGLYVSAADVAASLVTKNSVYIDSDSGQLVLAFVAADFNVNWSLLRKEVTKGSKPCASKHGLIDVKEVLTGEEQVDYVGDYASTIVKIKEGPVRNPHCPVFSLSVRYRSTFISLESP